MQSRMRSVSLMALVASVVLALSATNCLAGSVTYTASLPLGPTNWSNTMTFPKFDSTTECLDNVCITLNGHVEGQAKFESLDGGPATVTMNMQATITLQRPDLSTLAVVIPLAQTVDNVTAFDGTIDFGGTSGKSYDGLSGDKTENACTATSADLALFTGSGNIVLPCVATGSSNGTGAGNLILQFGTHASTGAEITYFFSRCQVPVQQATWTLIRGMYR